MEETKYKLNINNHDRGIKEEYERYWSLQYHAYLWRVPSVKCKWNLLAYSKSRAR